MSVVESLSPRSTEAPRRPDLRLVPRPLARMSRWPFLVVLAIVLGVGMVGLLLLNTTLQTRAFRVTEMQRQATALGYTEAELETQVALARSPETLAQNATALGMRPNPYPAFIELPSGKVLGEPQQVTGQEMTSMKVKSPQLKAAEAMKKTQRSISAGAQAQGEHFGQLARQRAAEAKKAEEKKQAEAKQAEEKKAQEEKAQEQKAQEKKSDQKKPTSSAEGDN